MTYHTYIAWPLLLFALITWCLVGFFAWAIFSDESYRLVEAQSTESASLARASAIRTHALALDTAAQGSTLGKLLDVDVVAVANMIEAAGKSAGVVIKLGDAVPENVPTTSDVFPIKAVGFVVEAQGKFPALMRVARLFETLPLPSAVTRLDLEHVPTNGSGSSKDEWHMNAYIRVLTTSDISS